MVKGSSLLIVGTSIFIISIFGLLIASSTLLSTDDYSQSFSMPHLSEDTNLKTFEEYLDGKVNELSFLESQIGIGIGILLIMIGGIKFVNEKDREQKCLVEKKPVSLVWQVIGSAFPGFDLFVMYRIKKLRLGSLVYASQFVIWGASYLSDVSAVTDTNIGLLVGIGYAVVVYVWSKKWNKQFPENSVNEELKMRKTLMVKREPVNINWQIVFAIIPYVQFYAAYRVEKFRLFFLLWVVIGVSIAVFNFFAGERIPYMSYAVGIPIYFVLIRKWSKEWNEQLSNGTPHEEVEDVSSHTPLG